MRFSLWTTTALAAAASAQKEAPVRRQIEIDAVFPANETYREAEIFPIVFAVQNMSAIREANATFELLWGIHRLNDGYSPAGLYSDEGTFTLWPNDTRTGPALFVGVSNVTKWFERPGWGEPEKEKYMFQWTLYRSEEREDGSLWKCPRPEEGEQDRLDLASGKLIFQARSNHFLRLHGLEDADYLRDTTDIPECPTFQSLLEIEKNATHPGGCPILRAVEGGQGNPCAVKIERPTVTSILAEATRLAELAAPSSEPPLPTSSTSTAAGPARAIPTALAAACVLCGLAL
ncbi:hypothetical protein VTH06DRAFT_5351 [Thermothelomyces fergusii]